MENENVVFDYRLLRLLMGLIALSIPFTVTLVSGEKLSSISASYYTDAQDVFVGSLFIVGAFLFAYNGHTWMESLASKIASLSAIIAALFPTSCDTCSSSTVSTIHLFAAGSLFLILAYFCFVPFQRNTRGATGKKGRRSIIYFMCGAIMLSSMLALVIARQTLTPGEISNLRIMFYTEAIALVAFGVAWIVSGKYLRIFTDSDEKMRIFRS